MRRFGFGRLAAAVAAAFLLVPLVATLASAHAQLDTPTPADKATVTQPVTVVGGTFVERVNPNGSSLVVKLVGGGTVATGGVDPTNAKQMVATPATPLGSGSYVVQWTTVSLDDGELARGTWTFTVAVAPSAAATPSASPSPGSSATVAPSAAATVPPTIAPTPRPSATGDTTGSGSDVVVPIIVALIVLGAGAAYLLSRRNRPTTPTTPTPPTTPT
jgi:methionine-rich copper-binding protein CopC